VLKLEILQLEGQAKKWIERLGAEAYAALAERGQEVLSASDPVVKGMLDEIAAVRNTIEQKEAAVNAK
jgi:hypothetical protein